MSSFLERIRTGNERYADRFHDPDLPTAPGRRAAVVTCMDSRIDALAAFGLDLGDAHIIRNAGALATDDVERSVLLSQYTMGTSTIVVIGHTRCGLVGVDQSEVAAMVEAERGVQPSFAVGSIASPESGVRRAVERFRESPYLRHTGDVHGFVYDVDTGRLTPVEAD